MKDLLLSLDQNVLQLNLLNSKQPSFADSPKKVPHSTLPPIYNHSVADILRNRITQTDKYSLNEFDPEDAFYVCDLSSVAGQHKVFTSALPRVEPFYAVKCNPDPMVLRTLNALGTGFDCASKGEMQAVLDMGVDPSRIIYANPCKQISHLRYAATKNIRMMTFDNADELKKIKLYHPNAQLVLRILTDDSKSLCKLGLKFGATLDVISSLLELAKELDLDVIGISFHVGSGCFDPAAFRDAVLRARKAFDIAESLGFQFTFLDVGGGFPGANSTGVSFGAVANVLGPILDELFDSSVRVIAEPGRYYVSAAYTLAVSITSRRMFPRERQEEQKVTPDDHPVFMYYVNDGMYGSFNCITFDHVNPKAQMLQKDGEFVYGKQIEEATFNSSIWGPTCDSIDCIGKNVMLPEMHVGDWLVYEDMGAYTMAAASNFNGFRKSAIVYTHSEM